MEALGVFSRPKAKGLRIRRSHVFEHTREVGIVLSRGPRSSGWGASNRESNPGTAGAHDYGSAATGGTQSGLWQVNELYKEPLSTSDKEDLNSFYLRQL
jgi:hypothetical protein